MSDERLRGALRGAGDEARLRRNWSAIAARRSRGRARPVWRARLALPVLAATALLVLALSLRPPQERPESGPLLLSSGADPAAAGATRSERDVELADGSRVHAQAATQLELLENDGRVVRWWLRDGRARFDVAPGGPRRWVVETGTVTVEVLGTSFVVERRSESVRVEVARGTVLVRGTDVPGGLQRLGAGESITVTPHRLAETAETSELVSDAVTPPRGSEPPRGSAEPARRRAPQRDVPEPSGQAAPSEPSAEALPVPSEPEPRGTVRDADALRSQGRVAEAATLLAEISRAPEEPRADRALAAFTLARLELDRLGRAGEAAASFAVALELGLDEPLAEAARARRVEALVRAGDGDSAREAAREYVRQHPAGRWRHQVERWTEP